MIRRLPAAVAAVVLTGVVASGCSTFSKNDEAARVGHSTLSVKDFETIIGDLATAKQIADPVNGEITGDVARNVLSHWINSHLLDQALSAAGSPVDATSRTNAADALKGSVTGWEALSTVTKNFLIDELAGQNSLIAGSFIPDGDAKLTYDAGVTESNTLCMRLIALPDETTAKSVYQQLVDGGDFATLADANNTDSTIGKGGIVSLGTPPSECTTASGVNDSVTQALASVKIGQPAPPQPFTGSDGTTTEYFIFMERPWEEVAKTAGPLVKQVLGPDEERRLVKDGAASVDSRYGQWDSSKLTVQPSR